MKELHKTSFWESLVIQKRVLGALLMREIITRYGRNNIGFLWLFVEPLLMTLVMVLMWKFFRYFYFKYCGLYHHRLSDDDDVAQCFQSCDGCNFG